MKNLKNYNDFVNETIKKYNIQGNDAMTLEYINNNISIDELIESNLEFFNSLNEGVTKDMAKKVVEYFNTKILNQLLTFIKSKSTKIVEYISKMGNTILSTLKKISGTKAAKIVILTILIMCVSAICTYANSKGADTTPYSQPFLDFCSNLIQSYDPSSLPDFMKELQTQISTHDLSNISEAGKEFLAQSKPMFDNLTTGPQDFDASIIDNIKTAAEQAIQQAEELTKAVNSYDPNLTLDPTDVKDKAESAWKAMEK